MNSSNHPSFEETPTSIVYCPIKSNDPREWQLLQAVRDLAAAMMTGDPNHPYLFQHIDFANFKGAHDRNPTEMDIYEFLGWIRRFNASYSPKTIIEITDEVVDIDESMEPGVAIVWQFKKIARVDEEIVRNGLRMSKWRMDVKGTWICSYFTTFRCDPTVSADPD